MPTDIEEAEVKKLFSAVDRFAGLMKQRLLEKARAGYTGWDNSEMVTNFHLISRMSDDINSDSPELKAVDIATRAMMLWYRLRG